jgi:isopentenyl-diphosphate delta-isomerase
MREEVVVLVDPRDNELGFSPKLQAHLDGVLHRAVSVFIMNEPGEMLLQRRAVGKYHSGGLWSNACCSHPRPGETPADAAVRRLNEEMGLSCALDFAFTFVYRAPLGNGLTEHELDHVFVGTAGADPVPNRDEVGDWRWLSLADLEKELAASPDSFTAWFPIACGKLLAEWEAHPGGRYSRS